MNVDSVEAYFSRHHKWDKELLILRDIIISTGLIETLKWGSPVYTNDGKMILGIGAFKSYFGLWFFQGALLKDDHKVLINAQEGKTKALRQWRFNSEEEVDAELIKIYIFESIQNQKEGKEIKPQRNKALIIPPELQISIDADGKLKRAFLQLSLSKKREFAEYIAEAKRETTKRNRLDKIIPMITEGIGLHDKYKNR